MLHYPLLECGVDFRFYCTGGVGADAKRTVLFV